MKRPEATGVKALGLVVIGLTMAAGICLGDTDDAPGTALAGLRPMIGTAALAVKMARRS